MLREGRGGLADPFAYRKMLTDIVWHGKQPEGSDAEPTVESAQGEIGKPHPKTAYDEARELHRMLKSGRSRPEE